MAKVTYKSYNQNDYLLFPHCIGDFIPENDPVRVLDTIVEYLNISAIEATSKLTLSPLSSYNEKGDDLISHLLFCLLSKETSNRSE